MKKIFLVTVVLLFTTSHLFASSNPIVRRLSKQEISQNQSPFAISYNYTMAVIDKDFYKVMSFLEPIESQKIRNYYNNQYSNIEEIKHFYFSNEDFPAIISWQSALNNGYEIVIADEDDIWSAKVDGGTMIHQDQVVKDGYVYIPGENKTYVGVHEKRIYLTCSPTSEIGKVRYSEVTRYNKSHIEVMLRLVDNKWFIRGVYYYLDDEDNSDNEVVILY